MKRITTAILALLMAVSGAFAAEGDTNVTNLVASGTLAVTGASTFTGAQTFTGAAALNGGAVLANTKDLTCATDGGSDIGASATEFGTVWVQTLDDGDGTVAVAAALTVAGNATVTGDVLPEADGTRSLGASGTEFGTAWVQTLDDGDGTVAIAAAATVAGNLTVTGNFLPEASGTRTLGTTGTLMDGVYTDALFTSPPTLIAASQNVESFVNIVTGASAAVTLTLHNATVADGMVVCIVLSDTTTNDVTVKSAGGTIGKTDRSAAGAAAGTGIVFTDTDDDKWGCWVSDGTNWVLGPATVTSD